MFTHVIDALGLDLRYLLRGLRAHPLFSTTVVLTIALGIGANATMFGIVDRLLLRGPEHVRDPERVVQVETHYAGSQGYDNDSFSYIVYTDLRDRARGFASVGAATTVTLPLGRGPSARRAPGALASWTFFPTLGVRPALGRFFTADEDDPDHGQLVAVIGYGLWQRAFGGKHDVLGQGIDIGARRFTIVGVAPRGFTGIDLGDVDAWLPIGAPSGLRFDDGPGWVTNRGATWLEVVARLKDGIDPRLATAYATAVVRDGRRQQIAEQPASARWVKPDSESAVLAPIIPGLAPARFPSRMSAQDVKVSTLLALVSLIVLIIACANVANLQFVRALDRRREIAVRLALGVSRARLVTQLLTEGTVLAGLGGLGALLITHWTSRTIRRLLLGGDVWTTDAVDGRLLAFTAIATLATTAATALAPALQATRVDLTSALKQGARDGGAQRSSLRTALLVVQASLAMVLLVGAGLFVRSVRNVNGLPFGIDLDHVLVADINHRNAGLTNEEARQLYDRAADDVRRLPGVQSVAVSIGLPFALNWQTRIYRPGRTLPDVQHSPGQFVVTPDYFTTMGVPLIAGRAFTRDDRAGAAPVAVINDVAARLYWPNESPIGQCAKIGADTMPCTTIVGVVGKTVQQNLRDWFVPQIYRPLDQLPVADYDRTVSHFGYEMVVRTRGDAARLAETVRRTIQSASPASPFANVRPMRDLLSRRMRTWTLGARVFSAFGVLALVLAAVGLYSVMAFSIAQRLHEFGVRLALGAQTMDVVRLTVRGGMATIVAGIASGLVLVLASGRFVASLLFNVSPRDPDVLAFVSALLLATGLAASIIPALRAARADPLEALRAE